MGITELPPFDFSGELEEERRHPGYPVRDLYVSNYNIIEIVFTGVEIDEGSLELAVGVNDLIYEMFFPSDLDPLTSVGTTRWGVLATNIVLEPNDIVEARVWYANGGWSNVVIVCRLGVPTLPPKGAILM